MDKFKIQDNQYVRPYHHLVSFDDPKNYDHWYWGIDYYGNVSTVFEMVSKQSFKQVAEVGCGDGKILLELAKKYTNCFFEGFDLSKQAIHFAKAYSYGVKNVNFFDKDFKYANKKYDLILCVETLEHISDNEVDDFLKTIFLNLEDDGKLILTVPSVNLPLNKKHYRHYDKKLLVHQTNKYFKLTKLLYTHNAFSFYFRILNYLLNNNFCLITNKKIRAWAFKKYYDKFRLASEKNCSHLLGVFKKR